ncbi:MAG: MFS transporter [Alphaproteobacteria bacterium]|nr:MFS transporter [Alphaproteobacteria bacterium]
MSTDSAVAGVQAQDYSSAYKVYVLLLLLVVYISNYADRMILSVLMPAIKAEFQVSDAAMGFLAGTAFAIFYATLGVPIAILADRSNRKNIISAAVAIWSVMTAVCGLAPNFWMFALARVGVGVGEAGGSPPSHSIISDLFGPKQRATALGIFALGVPFGLFVGLYGGAQVAAEFGWRATFYVLGIPGLILAALVFFTISEPRRGASDGFAHAGDAPALMTTVRHMLAQRSLVHVFAGATITTLVGYAGVQWWPTFVMRSHGLSMTDLSLFLALVFGVAGGLGTFLGGYIADHFSKRDLKWMPRIVTIATLIGLPFGLAIYLVESSAMVFALIGVPAALGTVYLPPTYAMTQGLVEVRMRTVASALLLFVINLIGMGLGPLLAGLISDALTPTYGKSALAYALLSLSLLNVWAAAHYWLAGRYFEQDLKRVTKAV